MEKRFFWALRVVFRHTKVTLLEALQKQGAEIEW